MEQTIDSVLSQGYPNLEYFVMDGGSSDNSVQIIKKYEKHLTGWVSESDKGQSHAINKGLALCKGDIFNWINSDDYYEPGAFEAVASAFENPSVSMVSFRANVFGLQKRMSRGTDIFQGNLPKAIAYSRIDQPETFFRMAAVRKMGPLNESLHFCMDKEWVLRYFTLFGNEGAINRDEIILNFRYHDDSKSVSLQENFETEADQIYLSLFRALRFENACRVLKSLSVPSQKEYQLSYDGFLDIDNDWSAVKDYYLFKRFVEKYESLQFDACKNLANEINQDSLSEDDKALLRKLNFRRAFLPKSIIKLLRIGRR